MEKCIDNEPTAVDLNQQMKAGVAARNQKRSLQIIDENKWLLQRINKIQRTRVMHVQFDYMNFNMTKLLFAQGVIDSFNPKAGLRHSNLVAYNTWIEKVERENVTFHSRLQSVVSAFFGLRGGKFCV